MGTELTAEKLAQRALDVNIVTEAELRSVWGELGTRNVEYEQFKQVLVRRGLVTNFQLERLLQNFRTGFFYGDYKVLYLVGAGTFARVYRATHKVTNELFAVKVLRKSKAEIPGEADLFRREGELGMKLKHPNIVAIHEVASEGKSHYMVMDFVEGHNLRDFVRVRGKFDPLVATGIAEGMVAGLNYAFQQGVTHRDLKMSNVILSSDGEAKLVDFGLAGLGGADPSEGGRCEPACNRLRRSGASHQCPQRRYRSDIFFAGCIYYQLMSGKSAIAETRDRVQRLDKTRYKEIKPLVSVAPDLPLPLVRICNKAIEFDPDRRYQTCGEMLADLKLAVKRISENKPDPALEKANAEPLEGHDGNGEPRRVMVVEADTKMQDLFRELFKKRGYRALVTSDPDRVFQQFYENSKTAEVLLLSSGHIGYPAVEAFNRLGTEASTKTVPVILLLGENQGEWAEKSDVSDQRIVLKMPVKSSQLRQAILKVLSPKS